MNYLEKTEKISIWPRYWPWPLTFKILFLVTFLGSLLLFKSNYRSKKQFWKFDLFVFKRSQKVNRKSDFNSDYRFEILRKCTIKLVPITLNLDNFYVWPAFWTPYLKIGKSNQKQITLLWKLFFLSSNWFICWKEILINDKDNWQKYSFDLDIDLDLSTLKYWICWPFWVLPYCIKLIWIQNYDFENLTFVTLEGHRRSTGSRISILISDSESWENFLWKWYQSHWIWTSLSRDLLSGHDISKTVRDIINLFPHAIFYFFIRNTMKNTRIKNIEEWPRKLKIFKKYKNWPCYWPLT